MIAAIAWKNIWRNRRRSILSMLAIVCSTLVIVLLFAILAGLGQDLSDIVTTYVSGDIRIVDGDYGYHKKINSFEYWLEKEEIEGILLAIHEQEEIIGVSPRIVHHGSIYRQGNLLQNVELVGIDPSLNAEFQDLSEILVDGAILDANTLRHARASSRLQPVMLGSLLAQQASLTLGSQFTVITSTVNYATNAMSFVVIGIVEFPLSYIDAVAVYAPRDAIASLAQFQGGATEIYLRVAKGADLDEVANRLQNEIALANILVEPWTASNTTYNMLALARISYTIIALIFFMLGSVAIINTTIMTIYERKREIGLLMALGMRTSAIRGLFFLESFYIALIAAGLGAIVGSGIVGVLASYGIDITAQMQGVDLDIRSVIHPKFNIGLTLLVWGYSVAVASVASFIPTKRVHRREAADILRDEV